MQVNNNYQPSFGKVLYHAELKESIKNGNFTRKALDRIDSFRARYEKSPVTVILGLIKPKYAKTRLDAQVFYREPGNRHTGEKGFRYLAETLTSYFFNKTPKRFLSKVAREVEHLTKKYCIG